MLLYKYKLLYNHKFYFYLFSLIVPMIMAHLPMIKCIIIFHFSTYPANSNASIILKATAYVPIGIGTLKKY